MHGVHERRRPGVLEDDQDRRRAGLHRLDDGTHVLVADQARLGALEQRDVGDPVDVADVERVERPVLVAAESPDVEHADDASVHEVDEEGQRLTGFGCLRRVADHHHVNRAEHALPGRCVAHQLAAPLDVGDTGSLQVRALPWAAIVHRIG